MILSTNVTNFNSGALGMVEMASSYLQDPLRKFWGKFELIAYLNSEQRTLASIVNAKYQTYFFKSATTPSVAGQSLYSMPADLAKLVGLEIGDSAADGDPQGLVEIMLTDRQFYQDLTATNSKNNTGFFFIRGTSVQLEPQVSVDGLTIRTYYVKRLLDMVADADTSEIPEEHHELLALGACRRAMAKKERRNEQIEALYTEGVEAMKDSIESLSPYREEIRQPYCSSPLSSVVV